MTEPERRKRGRPRAPEPHSRVTTWITTKEHDALIERARADEQSVSKTLRDLILAARMTGD